MRKFRRFFVYFFGGLAATVTLFTPLQAANRVTFERVIARFYDHEGGAKPQFIMMRELFIQSWFAHYEKQSDSVPSLTPDSKIVRQTLDLLVAETLLANRPIDQKTRNKLPLMIKNVQSVQMVRVGGEARYRALLSRIAGTPQAIETEVNAIFQRRALAELQVELVMTQYSPPNESDLRLAFAKAPSHLVELGFAKAADSLVHWIRAEKLREVALAYLQTIRSRLKLEIATLPATLTSPARAPAVAAPRDK